MLVIEAKIKKKTVIPKIILTFGITIPNFIVIFGIRLFFVLR